MTLEVENIEDLNAQSPDVVSQDDAVDDAQKPVFNQRQMQDAIKRERQKAYDKGQRDKAMELQQAQQQQPNDMNQQQPMQGMQQQSPSLGGMPQLSMEQIQKLIAEQAPLAVQQHVNQLKNESLVNSFVSKMQAAEQKYPGLEQKLNQLNYEDPRMHRLIEMTNNLENTGEVMNELVTNPQKMSVVLSEILNQPYLAQQQLSALANSIRVNQEGKAEEERANEPMSKLKPSANTGLADGKDLSVMDLRRMLSKKR